MAKMGLPIVLVANKADLRDQMQVPKERGEKFAETYQLSFHETSAKLNIGIDDCFDDIIEKTIQYKFEGKNFNKVRDPSLCIGSESTAVTFNPEKDEQVINGDDHDKSRSTL